MNKLITKIVGAALSLTMAVGVEIAVGASRKEAVPVSAATNTCYTLEPITGSDNGYASDEDITIDGIKWNVTGNTTLVPWRIGGKNLTGVNRSIYSKTAIAHDVSKIEIVVGAASSVTVNSMNVGIYSTASKAATGGTGDVANFTPTFATNSTIAVVKQDSTSWNSCYYNITFNVTIGGSNKYIAFTRAIFYEEASGSIDDVTISGTTSITSGYLGLATTQLSADVTTTGGLAETVTWESDDSSVAVVNNDGLVRFLKNDTANITATSTVDTNVSDTVAVSAQNLTAYTGHTDTANFTDTSTWGTATISDFSGALTNISFADGGSTTTKLAYNKAGNMRIYNGTKMTLTCSQAYSIEYIVATSESGYPFSAAPTSDVGTGYLFGLDWLINTTGSSVQSVALTYSGTTAYIDTLVVYYTSTGSCGITIDNAISTATRGDSGTFTATTSGATSPVISWSSSDTNVIAINSSTGAYTVNFVGTATITVAMTCNEGADSDSFDVTVAGAVSIAEANTILSGLSSGEQTAYKVTLTASIIDLNPNSKESGSENELTLADYKVGGTGNDLLVYGVFNDTKLSGQVFRNFAVLNGTLSITGYLKNYSGTYELVTPTLVSYTDDAIEFAQTAYAALQTSCNSGVDAVTSSEWTTLSNKWTNEVDSYSKAKLQAATSTYEYSDDIANWIARYTKIVENRTDLGDFMTLGVERLNSANNIGLVGRENSSIAAIIVIVSLVSITAIGGYFFIRKRKEQ